MNYRDRFKRISEKVFSRQVGIFLIFLSISAVLWVVTSLNEEVQRQITCRLRIVDVPDSVVFINEPPSEITVTVRGRGTHVFRNLLGSQPVVDVDFKKFVKGDRFVIGKSSFISLMQERLGDDRLVQEVYPDTLGLFFTTSPPRLLPVRSNINVTPTPNMHLVGVSVRTPDSVRVYAIGEALDRVKFISTREFTFNNVASSRTVRVPLQAPHGTRVVPDSVTLNIEIEPFVTEVRQVQVTAANLPEGCEAEFKPSKIKVSFRVPSGQRNALPPVSIVADFSTVDLADDNGRIAVFPDPWRSFVFIDDDSVSYYLKGEHKSEHKIAGRSEHKAERNEDGKK